MPDRPTLSAARTAVEVCEAVARWCWWEEHDSAECPGKRIPTPERLSAWVADHVTEAAQTEAAELLTALVPPDWRDAGAEAGTTITTTELLDNGAKGPPRVTVVPDRVDMARGQRYLLVAGLTARSMATDAPALYADLVEHAHRLWRDAGGRHPLAPLVDDLLRRAAVEPDKAHVRVVGSMTRVPYAVTEAARRNWRPAADVTAVHVDGEPLAARLQNARPKNVLDWLYVDDSASVPAPGGNLHLPDRSFGVYPQNAIDMPLTMVALRLLGALDGRSGLRSDIRLVLAVAYAATQPVLWTDWEGARLLARTKTGGFRHPRESDVERWRSAVEVSDSIRLYYRDKYGRAWIRVLVADPYGDGRTSISSPAWFRERAAEGASLGAGMGWTLTAAAHPARQYGEKPGPWQHVLANMEYWLARSYDHEPGIAPLLQPVRPGGPGPWVSMHWYEVLQILALESFVLRDGKARDAALRRYWRIVESFREAGYLRHGEAGTGDVIEIDASPRAKRRGRAKPPWLRFRATVRFCEAARLADAGKWQTTGLLNWFQTHDEPSVNVR